jgi:hypothetical protein
MAISVRRLLEMSDDEIRKMFDRALGNCLYAKCGKPVMSSDEKRYVSAGVYHTDCYFNEWGDEIEKNPICSPGRRGVRGSNLEVGESK